MQDTCMFFAVMQLYQSKETGRSPQERFQFSDTGGEVEILQHVLIFLHSHVTTMPIHVYFRPVYQWFINVKARLGHK